MCGCEQGLCAGCRCGCSHTWPPTLEEVERIVERERENTRFWINRVQELQKSSVPEVLPVETSLTSIAVSLVQLVEAVENG